LNPAPRVRQRTPARPVRFHINTHELRPKEATMTPTAALPAERHLSFTAALVGFVSSTAALTVLMVLLAHA
jgi:hypothetical protein